MRTSLTSFRIGMVKLRSYNKYYGQQGGIITMKILLISDIHGNLEALINVLYNNQNVDKIIVLGDIIGYMPNPNECIQLVKDYDCILGNHEYAILNPARLDYFNPYAKEALLWTKGQLTSGNISFLKQLPFKISYPEFNFTVAHGSIGIDPFEYIEEVRQAGTEFELMDTDILFIGHTHVPKVFIMDKKENSIETLDIIGYDIPISIDKNKKYIFNIGSVGQPRDRNPDSCYAIYNTIEKTVEYKRQPYNTNVTVRKIIENGLPRFLYERIIIGR